MDTELLVEDRIDGGRQLIAELVRDGFDVAVAFWAKPSEEELWSLYLASASVDAENLGNRYQQVYACWSRLNDHQFSFFSFSEIKIIPASNPIAQNAIAVRDRYAARIPTRYHGKSLGNLAIEEAYIYPQAIGRMTPDEVLQTVLALMKRTGAVQPSIVTLADGSTVQAIPTRIDTQTPGAFQITLMELSTGKNRVVSPDDVVNIQ
jgi:hypothetical protein